MAQTISPMLAVHDAEAAIKFYRHVFGAVEHGERHAWEGKIGHAEFLFGDSLLMLADEYPKFNKSPQTLGGTPVMLHLTVENVDATTARAVEAGAVVTREPSDQPYGRVSTVRDPFGHIWFLNQKT